MQSLIRSKSAGVTGGRGTAGAGPGRDLLYHWREQSGGAATLKENAKNQKVCGPFLGVMVCWFKAFGSPLMHWCR